MAWRERPVPGTCPNSPGALDSLAGIEDLEGSEGADVLYGDAGPNQLLGHAGADTYFALGGEDSILANSGDDDKLVTLARGARRVAFRFVASEAGSTFLCRLDSRPYRSCQSPRAYSVGRGRYVFRVTSTDSQRNRDRTPAIFRFRAQRGGK
ncbi:MAG: hypothetical protein ACTHO8_14000 [Solirubrobacterales bacterium]